MGKGNFLIAILTVTVFLAGIFAPVPECYVFRVACPVKTSFAAKSPSCSGPSCPARSGECCAKTAPSVDFQKQCELTGAKLRMKPYLPDIETVTAPTVPVALVPTFFDALFAPQSVFLPRMDASRDQVPDPIPILLRKQSLLI